MTQSYGTEGPVAFHPRMLVDTVNQQAPGLDWIPAALHACGEGVWEGVAYVRYVSAMRANQAGAEWLFKTSVTIEHSTFGTLVLDILEGNRLGGIEFLDRL